MTHTAMSIYTNFGDAKRALSIAGLVIDAHRDTMTPYDEDGRYDPEGVPRPSVNSHYARQTIWWAIPLALTGQQYDAHAQPKRLHFSPHASLVGERFKHGAS